AWSPGSTQLAYVSRRGDHAFVGVYDLTQKTIVYMNPSVDNDSNPVWSPDGKELAYIRVPGQRDILPFTPVRSSYPWSIHIATPKTGKSREIWKATKGTGSAFNGLSANNQLFWMNNGTLVFPWEGDGYINLYNIKADGSGLKMISAGKSEVQFAAISSSRNTLVFSGNAGDTDRQHVWKFEAESGKTTQITKGEGIEWAPVMTDKGNLYHLASGPKTPAFPALLRGGKIENIGNIIAYPNTQLAKPEQVIFSSTDGMQIHGQLFLPPKMKKGQKYPAVLFFHGGSRRQMLLGFHHRGYYHNAYAFNQYLANQGYIVLSVNYRSGIGYGMEFREALNFGAQGASEFQDVMGAGLYLRNRTEVDPNKIGLWGGSYGGYLTAMGLAKASNLFAAGVDIHGVHDWNVVIKNFVPGYNSEERMEFARLALASSPMPYVKDWTSPVLLIHGDDDRNVPFSETVDIAEELRKNDVYFEQLIFPDEVHGFLLHSNWMKAYEAAFDFFERKLK
ncbi:MAG: prolyl oligopeptidase family serine peptidase, partial [Cyclobacteriaceae bacterium]|nr:prolyl oligopeptidase family serine peptidase [Cyclobacteriaceae bacterium]